MLLCSLGLCKKSSAIKKIEDIDIATIFTPDELKKLRNSKFKIIDTGLEHGSVTILSDKKFEFTTLRKDVKTDGRHAEISIDDWKEDLKRRDFTINAIYLNKKEKCLTPSKV